MKFSILIPAYNTSKYIRRCLNSLINQTFQDFEIIVIDDGSKDDTLPILKEFQNIDKRVNVFHQENHGVAYTRNRLLDYAKGEWIVFVDADDIISDDYLLGINNAIEECPSVEIVFCSYCLETKKGIIIKPLLKFDLDSCCRDLIEKKNRLLSSALWSKSFKRSIITEKKIRFSSDFNMGEDLFFIIQFLFEINNIGFASNSVYFWNKTNEDSMTYSCNIYRCDDIKCYQAIISLINKNGLEKKFHKSINIGKMYLQNLYYMYIRNNNIKEMSPFAFFNIDFEGLNTIDRLRLFVIKKDLHFVLRCINFISRWFQKMIDKH